MKRGQGGKCFSGQMRHSKERGYPKRFDGVSTASERNNSEDQPTPKNGIVTDSTSTTLSSGVRRPGALEMPGDAPKIV